MPSLRIASASPGTIMLSLTLKCLPFIFNSDIKVTVLIKNEVATKKMRSSFAHLLIVRLIQQQQTKGQATAENSRRFLIQSIFTTG
jgi:hypothetical protein